MADDRNPKGKKPEVSPLTPKRPKPTKVEKRGSDTFGNRSGKPGSGEGKTPPRRQRPSSGESKKKN